jgi:hypothetical protein
VFSASYLTDPPLKSSTYARPTGRIDNETNDLTAETVRVSVLALLAEVVRKGGGMKRLVLSVAVVGTTLALAAGMALAQATTFTSNEKVPLDQIVDNPCTGELLHLTGELHMLFHVTEDANGGFHVQTHFQPQGVSGTGLVSGEQYRGVGVTRNEIYFAPGEVREFTSVNRFYMISAGPSDNMLETATIHVTFNANGEPTAELVRPLETKCAG